MNPQPPGPGLPLQPPSVNKWTSIAVGFSVLATGSNSLLKKCSLSFLYSGEETILVVDW